MLTKIFGAFTIRTKENIRLKIFITSIMDLSYIDSSQNNLLKKYINILNVEDIFVDVGANIGYYSILASKRVGDKGMVYSFEPSGREYKRLLDNIVLNDCRNIIPYNFALSNYQGNSIFLISEKHTGLNKLGSENIENTKQYRVPVFLLDRVITNSKEIALIKIDVEGAEFLVLLGMTELLKSGKIKYLIIEITPKFLKEFGHRKEMIYDLLDRYGYSPLIKENSWQYDEVFFKK